MDTDEPISTNDEPRESPQPEQPAAPAPPAQGAYTPPPPPRRGIRWWIPTAIGCGCLLYLFIFGIIVAGVVGILSGGVEPSGQKVAVIHIDGIITAGNDGGGFFAPSVSGSETISERLERARKDKDVKAIVLRLNSPGGSPAGSEEVYREIERTKRVKPVYASMGDVAASGAYYISAACDKIYADAATITGSIGVIFETTDLSGLFDKLGVDPQVVKSGKFKDMGGSHRPITPEERRLIQGIIDDTYSQFVDAVSRGRNLPQARVRELATGEVFTGRQAKNLKLIDEIGGLRETVVAAGRAAGMKGEIRSVDYDRRGGILGLLQNNSSGRLSSQDYEFLTNEVIRRLSDRSSGLEGLR